MHQKYLWNYCRMYIYLEFLPFLLHLFIGKGAVPDLHVYIIEWVVCGICDMVDTVSVSLDNSVGRDHAASTKNSEEDTANCVHGRKRMSRIFVWNTLCTGAGNSFWTEFQRDDCLDHCRIAVGFCARRQQFLLWNIDCSDCDTVAEVRETSRMRSV